MLGNIMKRKGAVAVEFAFVLPVFALVFGGIVEISRAILVQHTVDTAAYEGARAAAVPGASAEDAISVAKSLLQTTGLKEPKVTVDPTELTEQTAFVTVQVEVPINANLWLKPVWFKCETLKSQVTLKCERPPMVTLTGLSTLKLKKNAGAKAKPGL